MLHDAAATAFIRRMSLAAAKAEIGPEEPPRAGKVRTYETDKGGMTLEQIAAHGGQGAPGAEAIRRRWLNGERRLAYLIESVGDRKRRMSRESARNQAA